MLVGMASSRGHSQRPACHLELLMCIVVFFFSPRRGLSLPTGGHAPPVPALPNSLRAGMRPPVMALPERVQRRGEKNNTLLTAGHAPPVIALATRRKRRLEKEKIVHEQLVGMRHPACCSVDVKMTTHFLQAGMRPPLLRSLHTKAST